MTVALQMRGLPPLALVALVVLVIAATPAAGRRRPRRRPSPPPHSHGQPPSSLDDHRSADLFFAALTTPGTAGPALALLRSDDAGDQVMQRDTLSAGVFKSIPQLFDNAVKKYLFEVGAADEPEEFLALLERMLERGATADRIIGRLPAPPADESRPMTPLWTAVDLGDVGLAKLLLQQGGASVAPWTRASGFDPVPYRHGSQPVGWSALQGLAAYGRFARMNGELLVGIGRSQPARTLRSTEDVSVMSEDDERLAKLLQETTGAFRPDPRGHNELKSVPLLFWRESRPYRRLIHRAAAGELDTGGVALLDLLKAEWVVAEKMMGLLLGAGLDIGAAIGLVDTKGHNPFHLAAEAGNVAFVRGISAAVTALDTAAGSSSGKTKTAVAAAIQGRDEIGRSPLHIA